MQELGLVPLSQVFLIVEFFLPFIKCFLLLLDVFKSCLDSGIESLDLISKECVVVEERDHMLSYFIFLIQIRSRPEMHRLTIKV